MGLFDKLKGAVDIAKDTINKAIESMQEENISADVEDPLQDEIVKKYYDIIYDMRMSLGWFGEESSEVNSRAQKYIELVLDEAYDEERFVKAVELINLSKTDYPKNKFEEKMVNYRKSLYPAYATRDYKSIYGFDLKTVCEACYAELLAEIKSKYWAMLDAIEDDESCENFDDFLRKYIFDIYRGGQDSSVVKDCLSVAIMDSFFEGNEITKGVLSELSIDKEEELSESMSPEEIATLVSSYLHRII